MVRRAAASIDSPLDEFEKEMAIAPTDLENRDLMKKQKELKLPNMQRYVLKVNIHCQGCEKKVKKLLKEIDGVYSTKVDAEQGIVTVVGNVDPSVLIKKLVKKNKPAKLLAVTNTISANNNNNNDSNVKLKQQRQKPEKLQFGNDEGMLPKQKARVAVEDVYNKQRRKDMIAKFVLQQQEEEEEEDSGNGIPGVSDIKHKKKQQQQQQQQQRTRWFKMPFLKDVLKNPVNYFGGATTKQTKNKKKEQKLYLQDSDELDSSDGTDYDVESDEERQNKNTKTVPVMVFGSSSGEGADNKNVILEEGGIGLEGKGKGKKKNHVIASTGEHEKVEFLGGFDGADEIVVSSVSLAEVEGAATSKGLLKKKTPKTTDMQQLPNSYKNTKKLTITKKGSEAQPQKSKLYSINSSSRPVSVQPTTAYVQPSPSASLPEYTTRDQYYFSDDNANSCSIM